MPETERHGPQAWPLADLGVSSEALATVRVACQAARCAADRTKGPRRIAGYRLVQEISQGSQARVYRAVQESTGRSVAVKVIIGGPFLTSQRRARFDREARCLAALRHPNIVRIIDKGRTDEDAFFLVMDYIEGSPLDAYLRRRRGRPETTQGEVVRLFEAIARALSEAHRRGIVHRDVKPSNILVDARGEPHLVDFGLAHLTGFDEDEGHEGGALTRVGDIVGSLPYASPEQASGVSSGLSVASDVYSLGVVMYQALAGEAPYPTDGLFGETLGHIRTTPPRPPSRVAGAPFGRIDSRLSAVVLKCLAKSPGRRYPSAAELADDLGNWLAGRRVSASAGLGQGVACRSMVMAAAGAAALAGGALALLRVFGG